MSTKDSVTVDELPLTFQAKYMGMEPASGLWGIKHTRRPVDTMVRNARMLPTNSILPHVTITVSTKGFHIVFINSSSSDNTVFYPIDQISYGVQDMVYTRVFSMIVVKDIKIQSAVPFECYAFVCGSRNTVRKLTYSLAAAFQEYSKTVKEEGGEVPRKKFAIDLRTPEQLAGEDEDETEA